MDTVALSREAVMKGVAMLAALTVLKTPGMAQDAAICANYQAQYESEFRQAIMKAVEARNDAKARCEIAAMP